MAGQPGFAAPASTTPPAAPGRLGLFVLAAVASAIATVALGAATRVFSLTGSPSMGPGYGLSDYFNGAFSSPGGFAAGMIAAGLLGAATRSAAGVAVGMIAPFPTAAAFEVACNPGRHSHISIEILLWAILGGFFLGASAAGRFFRSLRDRARPGSLARSDVSTYFAD